MCTHIRGVSNGVYLFKGAPCNGAPCNGAPFVKKTLVDTNLKNPAGLQAHAAAADPGERPERLQLLPK